jgi:hypothetical protein
MVNVLDQAVNYFQLVKTAFHSKQFFPTYQGFANQSHLRGEFSNL